MTIRVYRGHGSNKTGAQLLIKKFQDHLDIPVAEIDEREIRDGCAWRSSTTALVFSGMSVGGFKAALGDQAQTVIQRDVADGAYDYIGICAGAAFGSGRIKYRMKDVGAPHGVTKIENTGLSFFNGLATGPSRSITGDPYSGWTDNLHLVTLRDGKTGERHKAFHWGGPSLIPMAIIHPDQGRVFSTLEKDGTPLGITLRHGEGRATLVSYHPEIDSNNIWNWAVPYIIEHTERKRLQELACCFNEDAFPRFLESAGLARPKIPACMHEKRPAIIMAGP